MLIVTGFPQSHICIVLALQSPTKSRLNLQQKLIYLPFYRSHACQKRELTNARGSARTIFITRLSINRMEFLDAHHELRVPAVTLGGILT